MERFWKTVGETFRELLPGADLAPVRKHFAGVPGVTLSTLAHFDGIVDELERLVDVRRMVALSGMPGSGKTSAACALAERLFDPQGFSTAFIDADSAASLRSGLVGLAAPGLLNVPGVKVPDGPAEVNDRDVERVLAELARWEPWLLILDNMDGVFRDDAGYGTVQPYLDALGRCRGGRVLITTRDVPGDLVARSLSWYEMPLLDDEIGARFLLERAGLVAADPAMGEDARAVSRLVGGLPLALDQAAAYVHEKQRTEVGYTLRRYLADYREAAAQVRQRRPHGRHKSSYDTFQLSFGSLSAVSQRVLLACALLDPEAIPLELLSACTGTGELGEVLRPALGLRLLTCDGDHVRLHREVHGVLGDILRTSPAHADVPQAVLAGMDALLKQPERPWQLSPHLQMLVDGGWVEAGGSGMPQLEHYLEGRAILRDIQSGTAWETLLFGDEEATFEAMHRLEEPEQRAKLAHRLAALGGVCTPEYARLIFACVYLMVHYWWDQYLEAAPLARPLLEIWERTHPQPEDQRLLAALRQFQASYPPISDYRARTGPAAAAAWNRTAGAVREVRGLLDLQDPPGAAASSAAGYARGILNIYLAESLRYATGDPEHAWPDNPHLDELYAEAVSLFRRNEDAFDTDWSLSEWADYHAEAGARCAASAGHAQGAGPHFSRARELCREGLQSVLHGATRREEPAALDAEVCARFYTTLGQAIAALSGQPEAEVAYRCAATLAAAAFVLMEEDVYSVTFYREQRERTLDALSALADTRPESLADACAALRKWWGRPALSARTVEEVFARGAARRAPLAELLLPPEARVEEGSSGADTELTPDSRAELQALVRVMPRRLARFPAEAVPQHLPEVARLLKAQCAPDGRQEEEG